MLMRHVGRLFGRHHAAYYLGGIVVSWTSFVLAMMVLYHLARLDLPRRRAERAVLLTAIFPVRVLLRRHLQREHVSAVHRPGVLSVPHETVADGRRRGGACDRDARHRRADVARAGVDGVASRPRPTPRDRAIAAAGLALSLVGFVWYCAYVYTLSGNPFEWAATLQRWNYQVGGAPWTAPLTLMGRLVTHPYAFLAGERVGFYDVLYGVTGILFLAAVPFVWRRLGAAYGLFMLTNLLAAAVVWGVRRRWPLLLGPVSLLHLAGVAPIAGRRNGPRRGVRAVLHARSRALHDDPSAVLNARLKPSRSADGMAAASGLLSEPRTARRLPLPPRARGLPRVARRRRSRCRSSHAGRGRARRRA